MKDKNIELKRLSHNSYLETFRFICLKFYEANDLIVSESIISKSEYFVPMSKVQGTVTRLPNGLPLGISLRIFLFFGGLTSLRVLRAFWRLIRSLRALLDC